MNRWLREHNKKLLAIFGVALMIAFILPANFMGHGFGGPSEVGKAWGEPLPAADVQRTANLWRALSDIRLGSRGSGPQQWVPIHAAVLGEEVAYTLDRHPVAVALLQREAARMGVTFTDAQLQQLLDRELIGVRQPDGSVIPIDDVRDKRYRAAYRAALAMLMQLRESAQRATFNVKISAPLREAELAQRMQTIGIRAVEIPFAPAADEMIDDATLAAHLATFAQQAPGTPTRENPLGLGYLKPDRVKLQYVRIPVEAARAAVIASRSEYDWEKDARKFYLTRKSEFPSTRPTTQPDEHAFQEVRETVLARMRQPEIDAKMRAVRRKVEERLLADFKAVSTTQPTADGAPAPGSFAALEAMAAEIQKSEGVLPTVVNLAEKYLSLSDLAQVPGLGTARSARNTLLPAELFRRAAALHPDSRPNDALALLQPSEAMVDVNGDLYIVRLTDAQPRHAPTLDEVREEVRRDILRLRALEQARAEAQKALEVVRKDGIDALGADRRVLSIDNISAGAPVNIPGVELSPASVGRFVEQAFDLLREVRPGSAAPVAGIIELPADGRLFVAQLVSVTPAWKDDSRMIMEAMIGGQLAQLLTEPVVNSWFDLNQVAERCDFKDLNGKPIRFDERNDG
jgi:hypothetical protein